MRSSPCPHADGRRIQNVGILSSWMSADDADITCTTWIETGFGNLCIEGAGLQIGLVPLMPPQADAYGPAAVEISGTALATFRLRQPTDFTLVTRPGVQPTVSGAQLPLWVPRSARPREVRLWDTALR